ncbi:hypothetical protein ATANTOWER_010673, partial [Ataeniobius toweri]|nr:hypothetical protein [Ataeniobius toweri]
VIYIIYHSSLLTFSAAAALGNLVSDLAGLGLAGYVEALAFRLGMQIPELSPKQADMWQTRVSCHTVCITKPRVSVASNNPSAEVNEPVSGSISMEVFSCCIMSGFMKTESTEKTINVYDYS